MKVKPIGKRRQELLDIGRGVRDPAQTNNLRFNENAVEQVTCNSFPLLPPTSYLTHVTESARLFLSRYLFKIA